MIEVWALPASLRIVLLVFSMLSCAFLLFASLRLLFVRRHPYKIAYYGSLLLTLLLASVARTPILKGLDPTLCDYLSLLAAIPFAFGVFLFIKERDYGLILDGVFLLSNVSLLSVLPYYAYVSSALLGLIVVRSVLLFFSAMEESERHPGRMAIKKGLDGLSEGVMFANLFHQITYLNKAMEDALGELGISSHAKADMIYIALLKKATRVLSPRDFIIASKGKAKRFLVEKGSAEIVCFESSKEEELLALEEEKRAELSLLNADLNAQLDNVAEMQKEKELLAVKGYIHDSLAQKLSILHMFLLASENNDLRPIKAMLSEFELAAKEEEDDLPYLANLLREVGVELTWDGEFPIEEKARRLYIKTIKECASNAIRHGEAKHIKAEIKEHRLSVHNDGAIPEDITYGNGLNGIEIEAEHLGYALRVEKTGGLTLILEKEG